MDILEQYEKSDPQVIRSAPQRQLTPEYGIFVRLVMQLSGGRIRDIRKASMALLVTAGVIMFVAILVFFGSASLRSPSSGIVPSNQIIAQ